MSLLDDVPAGAVVGLDTMVWIYEFEANPQFGPIAHEFYRDALATGRNPAGSSLFVLGEVLVQPLTLGRTDIADEYRRAIVSGGGFALWELTRAIVEEAAALRAKYRLKMLDCLHVATAILNGAALFISNDESLRRVTELKVLVLADYLPTGH